MNSHDILYTKEMILAKKAGLKTVTRRLIKPQPKVRTNDRLELLPFDPATLKHEPKDGIPFEDETYYHCPYGKPGDLLYTKENFQIIDDMPFEQTVKVRYKADGEIRWVQLTNAEWEKWKAWKQPYAKKSKLFMFKSLSRFWDNIIAIDVERVRDISFEEIKAEGTIKCISTNAETGNILWPIGEKVSPIHYLPDGIFSDEKKHLLTEELIYRAHFSALWDSMYAGTEEAWEHNPWVWVIRCQPVDVKAQVKEGIV